MTEEIKMNENLIYCIMGDKKVAKFRSPKTKEPLCEECMNIDKSIMESKKWEKKIE